MFKIHILNMKKMVEMAILMVRHQEPMLVEYSKIVDNQLSTVDSKGNSITYREFDVNNKIAGQSRDAERLIRGSDNSVYYTNNHYQTFIKLTK